jgi:RNA polymerase sigma-70 factor (ECF subfamily)
VGIADGTRTNTQARMSDREIDQQLVEKAQTRRQEGLRAAGGQVPAQARAPCSSRVIRDPAEIEDVAQEAFIKGVPGAAEFSGATDAFYTWLYRIGHQYGQELPDRVGAPGAHLDEFDKRGGRGFEDATGLRDINNT